MIAFGRTSRSASSESPQETALRRFLADGRLPLHNNRSELELPRQVIGRKNWLFVGSDDAATVNTTFVSLLASCAIHRLEPWEYLRDLFCPLPEWPSRRILDLAPAYWLQTHSDPTWVSNRRFWSA